MAALFCSMKIQFALPLAFFGFAPTLCLAGEGSHFRGHSSPAVAAGHIVETSMVQSRLQEVLNSTGRDAVSPRLAALEKQLWRTFQALPKNELGRLAPRAVRYIVHGYFAKEHGWLINGLGPEAHVPNASEVHSAGILQDKAPALVEALLEQKEADHGLALGDVVAMVATLEQLIFEESRSLLEAAYFLNRLPPQDDLDEDTLHEVLTSYLLLFEQGGRANLTSPAVHEAMVMRYRELPSFKDLSMFEHDMVKNLDFMQRNQVNPFVPRRYSKDEASQIVVSLAEGYGKWQNAECRQMKAHLVGLDETGTGRVPVRTFYMQPREAEYHFTESMEYLRHIGALDETVPSSPRVLIANYMVGPSNCIASSNYFAVCCLSECEGVVNELEGALQRPTASPQRLLDLVQNISSSSVDAPRSLPPFLEEKLNEIAAHHDGEVPLHGRLFAQWLHFAFPNECPYPQALNTSTTLSPKVWSQRSTSATFEEKQQLIEAGEGVFHGAEVHLLQWSEEEVLPLGLPEARSRSNIGSIARIVMQVAALLVVLRLAFSALSSGMGALGMSKEKSHVLPLYAGKHV